MIDNAYRIHIYTKCSLIFVSKTIIRPAYYIYFKLGENEQKIDLKLNDGFIHTVNSYSAIYVY